MAVAGQRVGLAGLREEDVSRPRPGRCKGAVLSPRGSASSFPAAPHGVSPPSQRLHTGEEPTECNKYEEISHRPQLSRHMSDLSQDRNPMLAINLEEPSAFIHHRINIR
ncbi:uncharacterized protein LOC132514302 isoform X4 [Lagenorhynchus albirostris]|uniref:uncharacterized protein LOC132514302 isoform X4 n=1 Tax=Lagenorhynchus albirostris TaxID=27610 RepID=UPI0028E46A6C|nr:uncharacterized protein LOC132514302 isoform X4 [Lagenorhynchus albirostris]